MFKELRVKYTDNFLIKNEKFIREFYNFKFDINETIDYVYNYFKTLVRKLIFNNKNFRLVYGLKVVYTQLLINLLIIYDAIRDI